MRNIPLVTKNLLILNIVAYLATVVLGRIMNLEDLFGLHFCLAPDFKIYQLFSYMFMHASFTHILFNMFALWMFGCVVENVWGPRKFLIFYLVCGVGAGLFQEGAQMVQFWSIVHEQYPDLSMSDIFTVAENSGSALNSWTTVGASGAVYGILLAFGMLFPEERMFIIPIPFPIKAKWLVAGYAVIEIFMALQMSGDGVAHLAHLGGMAFGYFLIRYWHRHPSVGYGRSRGEQFFDRMRTGWEQRRNARQSNRTGGSSNASADTRTDWDYNARQRERQAETDRILDKIRRSGYDSLTADEKRHLFDNSK